MSSNSLLLTDVDLKGKLVEKDNLVLGCNFEGNIVADKLEITQAANIVGNINANSVDIQGKIKGEITAKKVGIKKLSNIEGEIIAESLSIEDGANLKIQALTKKNI